MDYTRDNFLFARFNLLGFLKLLVMVITGVIAISLCIEKGDQFMNSLYEEDTLDSLRSFYDEIHVKRDLRITNNSSSEENTEDSDKIDTLDIQQMLEQQKEIEDIASFYTDVSDKLYKGKWTSETPIDNFDNKNKGEFDLRIIKLVPSRVHLDESKAVLILFRMLDGDYLDRWIFANTYGLYMKKASFKNNTYKGSFVSKIDRMEIFQKIQATSSCQSEFTFTINRNNTESSLINTIIGDFKSDSCNLNVSFETELHNSKNDGSKYFMYSFFISTIAIISIYNNIMMNNKITDHPAYSNSISLLTVGQSIIWNAYGCLCHFFLTVNFENYMLNFSIPAILYFINFSVFELRFMYNIWKNHNSQYSHDPLIMRRKLVQFYFTFYICMFISLFFVMRFYFDKFYIVIGILMTWLPQIVFNTVYNNKTTMPLFYIIVTSINRMYLPFYFRGCPENFFQLSTDYRLLTICLALMFIEIFFIYSQNIMGSRWFLPKALKSASYDFFKDKEEVMDIYPSAENIECVICLFPLFASHENMKHMQVDDFIEIGPPRSNFALKMRKMFYSVIYYLFEFHEIQREGKPYMMTPCRHFFHSHCLQTWFKQKKECPNCRRLIDEMSF